MDQQDAGKILAMLGDKFFAKEDYTTAIRIYQKAAELGDILAQYNLALMYELGEGTDIDAEKAVYWYKKAAKSGLPESQINLALCYYVGNRR